MAIKLYGDGIHDDTKAIQELIDGAKGELHLPMPKTCYLISAPLELPCDFKLCLPRYATVKLAKGSNCVMLKNKTEVKVAKRKNAGVSDYVNVYSPDAPCKNIEVEGGIWDYNNKEQQENPFLERLPNGGWHWNPQHKHMTDNDMPKEDLDKISYNGYIFLFYNVKNLRLSSMTLKDPVTFAITLDTVTYFTVSHITFDFNHGNPLACNMDGVHLNGNCHFGTIEDIKGACHDDLVALNADEGLGGPISHITIRGIYAEDCHSAVRLLAAKFPVKHVHISDVHGTFYQYCIGITRFYAAGDENLFDAISIDNIFASKAERLDVYNHVNDWVFSIIHFDSFVHVKSISISHLHREEKINPISTFFIGENAVIEKFFLENITTENDVENTEMPFMINNGKIENLFQNSIFTDGLPYSITNN